MGLQVLVATMNQRKGDFSLVEKMNINTEAIICNQSDYNDVVKYIRNGREISWYSFCERGVGLNRNNALMRASQKYISFADDDMTFVESYEEMIIGAFEKIRDADVIIFNVRDSNRARENIKKIERVNYLNYLRYGTARISCKLSSIKSNGIFFNQCFGGGTEHSHGEDNLFLTACLKNGLKIYTFPAIIATLNDERDSSWNNGFDEKYIRDQGVLYYTISRRWWKILCLQDAFRRYKTYGKKATEAYRIMSEEVHAQIKK